MYNFIRNAAAAAALSFVATNAFAVTVTFGPTPGTIFMNPLASSSFVSGSVNSANYENITSGAGGVNPWGNNNAGSYYSSVGNDSSLTYTFGASDSISFLWGTPDGGNNDLIFHLVGGGTAAFTATSLGVPGDGSSHFVTIGDVGIFNSVTFASDQRAFEFGNLSATAVPLPAALPLLLVGLTGLGAVGRRRKRS